MSDMLKDATARPWNNGQQADGPDWLVEHDCASNSAAWSIGSKNKTVAIAVTTGRHDNQEFEANARLIVTAVNSYEPMLAALEEARDSFQDIASRRDHKPERATNAAAAVISAIALAKGAKGEAA